MRRLRKVHMLVALLAIVAALGVWLATPVSAGNTTCATPAGGSVVIAADDLIVNPGGFCFLRPGSVITGNVKVETGAFFSTFLGGVIIGGNVQADKASVVSLVCTTVGGDVRIKESTGFTRLTANDIDGNVQIKNQSGGSLQVGASAVTGCPGGVPPGLAPTVFPANDVGGNVQLKENRTTFPATVGPNTIGGNLQCKENTPTFGVGVTSNGINAVSGDKKGQCAGFP